MPTIHPRAGSIQHLRKSACGGSAFVISCLLAAPLLSLAAPALGPSAPVVPRVNQSLDDALLDGLEPALRSARDPQSESPSAGKPDRAGEPASKSGVPLHPARDHWTDLLDQGLLDADLMGEDLGQPGETENPLLPIVRQMREVENRIAADRSDKETQLLQQELLSQLEALISTCQKCQGGSCKQPGGKASSAAAANKPGSQSGTAPLSQPAAKSSSQLVDRQAADQAQAGDRELLESAWGQLPARFRAQILDGAGDEFLPKYERQIRQYFQRLVEQDERGR